MQEFDRWDVSGQQWKDTTRDYIKKKKYKSVLDCGAGNFSEYYSFKENGIDIEYTGIDITKRFVENAKTKGINAYHGSIQSMPFKDETFDVVICYDIINHQREILPCIDEALRVAKKEVIIGFHAPWAEERTAYKYLKNKMQNRDVNTLKGITEEGFKMGIILYKDRHLTNFIYRKSLIKAIEKRKFKFAFETIQFNTMVWHYKDDNTKHLISTPQVLPKNILNIWKG